MADIIIGGNTYESYATQAFADEYLAADVLRSTIWAASTIKGQALVSATRLLQRQQWRDGVPSTTDAPEVVQQATALIAADILTKPAIGDSGSTSSNVKAVGAGSARVEFFAPVQGNPLPSAAFELLRGLLGTDDTDLDSIAEATAYGSDANQRSRFDETDFGLIGDGSQEELLW